MTIKLRDCPFCSAKESHESGPWPGKLNLDAPYWVQCRACGAGGPTAHEKEKAMMLWNNDFEKNESYPEGWVKAVLMINKDTMEIHCIGGDRQEGEGDRPYLGLELIKKAIGDSKKLKGMLYICEEQKEALSGLAVEIMDAVEKFQIETGDK